MNKRYLFILAAFISAVVLDAFIFTVVLNSPYSRVPMMYHLGDILMLTCGLAALGDRLFNGGVLR